MPPVKTKKAPKAKVERVVVRPYRIEPPVGWPVHWYPAADRNRRPCAAIPYFCAGRGVIGLDILDQNDTRIRRNSVSWMGDPNNWLKRDFAAEQGGWDWIPGLVPKEYQDMIPEEPTILMLYLQHRRSPTEIAEYFGEQWSVALVEAILEKHKALDRQNVVKAPAMTEMQQAPE